MSVNEFLSEIHTDLPTVIGDLKRRPEPGNTEPGSWEHVGTWKALKIEKYVGIDGKRLFVVENHNEKAWVFQLAIVPDLPGIAEIPVYEMSLTPSARVQRPSRFFAEELLSDGRTWCFRAVGGGINKVVCPDLGEKLDFFAEFFFEELSEYYENGCEWPSMDAQP